MVTMTTSSHCGMVKNLVSIRRRFFWPKMVKQVRDYIAKCDIFKNSKHPTLALKPPMRSQVSSERPFQRMYIDFIGLFSRTKKGNFGTFIVLDQFLKLTFLEAVKKFTIHVVIDFLRYGLFPCFGVPKGK